MIKKVVVFAGNTCRKEREQYFFALAYELGKRLAEAGFVVCTGGGPGLMEEVMRGAYEHGGHTIGICLREGLFRQTTYIHEKEEYTDLGPRQEKLLSLGDAYIALPGGIGTVYEVCQVLALKRKGEITSLKPLILLDEYFDEFELLVEGMFEEGFVDEKFTTYYELAKNPARALEILKKEI